MITLVYSYFNSGQMLERHLAEWQSYAPHVKENFRAVIVDDCSEKDPAANHMREVGFPVELYRILPPKIVWNTPGARNLGMDRAPDGFCLLTDIDHLLQARDAERFMEISNPPPFENGDIGHFYYTFARRWADGRELHPHPNSFLIERFLYWRIGGCDEDWSGWWGAGEQVFRRSLQSIAVGINISTVYLTHFGRDDIPDASTREWGRKNSEWDWRNNPALVEKAKGPPYKPERPLRFKWERLA